ncbi:MAG: gamma-glutamyl-gamma-aminobutyrate hydrolase family protein [Puniceicoccales bacterium]|jgi:putative glutamine amidotransferase|nr:gamma-glutamyl-gamma-aminobutyrate hydrolase family protein [Puniceicoccales bacterium]
MTKKIGITQRVETVETYAEVRDALDQRWYRLFAPLDILLIPIPNAMENIDIYCRECKLDGFVLTGGNHHPLRDRCEESILDCAVKQQKPILGVCHGMQFFSKYFRAPLVLLENSHVACEHPITIQANRWGFPEGICTVNSYHRHALSCVPTDFTGFAFDKDGYCEAMQHNALPLVACMWHPERDTSLPMWFHTFLKKLFQA